MRARVLLLAGLLLAATPARALDLHVEGYGDLRLVAPPAQGSYLDGGLGKLRFGEDDANLKLGDLVGEVRAGEGAGSLQGEGRLNAEYGPPGELLKGFDGVSPDATLERPLSL